MNRYYTFKDLSALLSIPLKTIYYYHKVGQGPKTHKFGKHLRVSETSFQKWQEERVFDHGFSVKAHQVKTEERL